MVAPHHGCETSGLDMEERNYVSAKMSRTLCVPLFSLVSRSTGLSDETLKCDLTGILTSPIILIYTVNQKYTFVRNIANRFSKFLH